MPEVLLDGYAYRSLSMTAYALGTDCEVADRSSAPAAEMPDTDVVPSDDTNI